MAHSNNQQNAQAAWDRIAALGGAGVCEKDIVIVSFNQPNVSDADFGLFDDFPSVETLDLSHTQISDQGLAHLLNLRAESAQRDRDEDQRRCTEVVSVIPSWCDGDPEIARDERDQPFHG